jgi:hypothetical protein
MPLSNNMVTVMVVGAVVVAAIVALVLRGTLSAGWGRFKLRVAGGNAESRNIAIGQGISAAGAEIGNVTGDSTGDGRPGDIGIFNKADLSGAKIGDIIGATAPPHAVSAAPEVRTAGSQQTRPEPATSATGGKPKTNRK